MTILNLLIKQNPLRKFIQYFSLLLCFALITTGLPAQETVEINGQDIGSWFERNWMWVTGAVVLLLILLIALSRGRSGKVRKTTTVVKDTYGNVKSVTTTEEKP
jgi:choline-glycine betaine transporter